MAERYTSRTLREILRIIASRFLGMIIILALFVGGTLFINYASPRKYRTKFEIIANAGENLVEGKTENQLRERVGLFISAQKQILTSDETVGTALYFLNNPPADADSAWNQAIDDEKEISLTDEQKTAIANYIQKNVGWIDEVKKKISVLTPGGADANVSTTFAIEVDWAESRKKWTDPSTEKSRKKAVADCKRFADLLYKSYSYQIEKINLKQAEVASNDVAIVQFKKLKAERDKIVAEKDKYIKLIGSDFSIAVGLIQGEGVDSGLKKNRVQYKTDIEAIRLKNAKLQVTLEVMLKELAKEPNMVATFDPDFAAQNAITGDKIDPKRGQEGVKVIRINFPSEAIRENPQMTQLQQQMTRQVNDLNMLEGKYTNQYQVVKETRQVLYNSYCSMVRMMIDQYKNYQNKVKANDAQIAVVQAALDKIEKRMADLSEWASKLRVLEDNYKAKTAMYDDALRKKDIAEQKVKLASLKTYTLLQSPVKPDEDDPRRPIIWLNLIIGCFAGLIFAFTYAFLADYFDHTIKSVDDAERYLGTPVLASMPKLGRNIVKPR